jgi:hypothetical protein
MLPGWNLATKIHIACDVGVRKALHLDFETCKMYIYYGVYTHPIVNCMCVYVVMRTLYVISCTTQWGLYSGKWLIFLMDIYVISCTTQWGLYSGNCPTFSMAIISSVWLWSGRHVLICFPPLHLSIMLIKFYAKGNFIGLSCKELFSWILWMVSLNGFFFYVII